MDYNDIKSRLLRTLKSFDMRFEENVKENIHFQPFDDIKNKGFSILFGSDDSETIMNKIILILHNLSSLKDHIKNNLKLNNKDPKIVELEIDKSIHLQVLIDIVNQEKHGTPLRNSRSGKNPIIKNPSQALRVSPESENNQETFFTFYPEGRIEIGGNSKIIIRADIYDSQDNLIFSLDELIDESFSIWERLITNNNCI